MGTTPGKGAGNTISGGIRKTGHIGPKGTLYGKVSDKVTGGCDQHGGGYSFKGGPEKGPVKNNAGKQEKSAENRTKP
jgi:hypothetical protein